MTGFSFSRPISGDTRKAFGTASLESAGWEGGLLLPGTTRTSVLYRITDHLGSIRAVRDAAGKVRQRFDYYPFGSVSRFWNDTPVAVIDTNVVSIDPIIDPVVPGNGLNGGLIPEIGDSRPVSIEETPQSALRYRFGGKEIAGQKVSASAVLVAPAGTPAAAAGRPYLDFGARLYDPRTAAWLAPDPLSEKYYPISPYAYCAGNPVNRIDHDGLYTYLLNYQYGTLTREGEEGEYDILYATNPANGGEVISIRINDRSLHGDLYQNNLNTDNSSVRTKNKAEVADLFMFLSKNSAVEWELAGINNGGMSYILMTSHDKNRVTSALIMRRQEEQNMVFSIHSHPTKGENDDQASGSWDSPSGDLGSARRIMNIQGTLDMNSKPYFFVYSVPRDELIRYTGENPHVSSRSIRGVKKPLDGIMKIQ